MKVDYLTTCGAILTRAEREYLRSWATIVGLTISEPVFVNIGVEYGASVHCLRAGSKKAKIYGIDIKPFKMVEGTAGIVFIQGDSRDEKIASRVTEPVHLLFIDGGHSYENVLADIVLWTPKVVVGGVVIFHDYIREVVCAEVDRAVNHWCAEPTFAQVWKEISASDSLKAFQRI